MRNEESARQEVETLFLANLPVIDAVVGVVARRHRLSQEDAEEFRSLVRFKLVDDNYAVLRKFRGASRIKTYLSTVIQNLFLDERVREWGRWRPSLHARRSGPIAILFEMLVVRDRRSFDEACAELESRGISANRNELRHLFVRMPVPSRPRFVDSELAADAPAPGTTADQLLDSETAAVAAHAAAALQRAMTRLAPPERLKVRLRFVHGLSMVEIARALSEDQKGLYREFDRLIRILRASLESDGVDGGEIVELLGDSRIDFEAVLQRSEAETGTRARLSVARPPEQPRENL